MLGNLEFTHRKERAVQRIDIGVAQRFALNLLKRVSKDLRSQTRPPVSSTVLRHHAEQEEYLLHCSHHMTTMNRTGRVARVNSGRGQFIATFHTITFTPALCLASYCPAPRIVLFALNTCGRGVNDLVVSHCVCR